MGAFLILHVSAAAWRRKPFQWARVLSQAGLYVGFLVLVGAPDRATAIVVRVIGALVWSRFAAKKMVFFIARVNKDDLTTLGEFMATGKMTPVIDKRYRLSEASEAFQHMKKGHARGKVVITLDR